MRKLLFFFLFLLACADTNAQNYTVGVPVDDTIGTITFFGGNACLPAYDFSVDFLPSIVTGIEYILIFANVTPTDSVYTDIGDTINTGDTLFFTPMLHIHYFYFLANGHIDCVFKAIGTPQIANEPYYCGIWWWDGDGLLCIDPLHCSFSGACTVSDITSVTETANLNKEVWINPNPTATSFSIQLPPTFGTLEKLEIFNSVGQMVGRFDKVENVDISGFPSGLYLVVVTGEDGERMTGRVVKE